MLITQLLVEKFCVPLSIEACTRHVHFSNRQYLSTTCSNIYKVKYYTITNSLSMSWEMFSVREGLPESEFVLYQSSTQVALQHNGLIFKVIYNKIMVYYAARNAKELESEISCQTNKYSRGLPPTMHQRGGQPTIGRVICIVSPIRDVIAEQKIMFMIFLLINYSSCN